METIDLTCEKQQLKNHVGYLEQIVEYADDYIKNLHLYLEQKEGNLNAFFNWWDNKTENCNGELKEFTHFPDGVSDRDSGDDDSPRISNASR